MPTAPAWTARKERLAKLKAQYAETCAEIMRRFPSEAERILQLEQTLRCVLIVLGSPRGGTSVFKETLSHSGHFVSLPGEHRALFTLLGRNFPDHGDIDEADDQSRLSAADKNFLLRTILIDAEQLPSTMPSLKEIERYGWSWALRLPVQWTSLDIEPLRVCEAATRAIDTWRQDVAGDPVQLSLCVLRELQQCYPTIDPWLYDLPADRVRQSFPNQPMPSGPPPGPIVEITPFVCPQLARARHPSEDKDETLILKASSDAYRVNSLYQLFTGWDLRVLHLTRNPLATVNGLLDGWAHHGFWQHDLSASGIAADRAGWCFDLVKDWAAASDSPLEEICLRQWCEPHGRILESTRSIGGRYLRLQFERFQIGGAPRAEMLQQATRHGNRVLALLAEPRHINVSKPFGPARWKHRADRLLPLINDREIKEMCSAFGYATESPQSWL